MAVNLTASAVVGKAMTDRAMTPPCGTSRNTPARSVARTGIVGKIAADKAAGTSSFTVVPAVRGPEYRAVNTHPPFTGVATYVRGHGVKAVGVDVSNVVGTVPNSLVVMSGNTAGGVASAVSGHRPTHVKKLEVQEVGTMHGFFEGCPFPGRSPALRRGARRGSRAAVVGGRIAAWRGPNFESEGTTETVLRVTCDGCLAAMIRGGRHVDRVPAVYAEDGCAAVEPLALGYLRVVCVSRVCGWYCSLTLPDECDCTAYFTCC